MKLPSTDRWDASLFQQFREANPDLACELDEQGNVLVTSPSNTEADGENTNFLTLLNNWAWEAGFKVFGPSARFLRPNGSVRSPDASVVSLEQWNRIPKHERRSYTSLSPLFVMELRSSESDPLPTLQEKMAMYIDNDVPLGWLLDPMQKVVEIYRPNQTMERVLAPSRLSADPELPGLEIDFERVWGN